MPGTSASDRLRYPLAIECVQPRVPRRARVQHYAIAHPDRLALGQRPRLFQKRERRGREVTVIAREPRTRRPWILRMVHHRQTLHQIPPGLAVITAPPCRLAISAVRSGAALG